MLHRVNHGLLSEYTLSCSSSLLNPTQCSFRSVVSTTFSILMMITLQNTLLGIESNVTPFQSFHWSAKLPFLGIPTIVPSVQSFGNSSFPRCPRTNWGSSRTVSAAISRFTLNSSAFNASLLRWFVVLERLNSLDYFLPGGRICTYI